MFRFLAGWAAGCLLAAVGRAIAALPAVAAFGSAGAAFGPAVPAVGPVAAAYGPAVPAVGPVAEPVPSRLRT
jgi:hypothetical protein